MTTKFYEHSKVAIDRIAAFAGLLLISPLLVAACGAVRLETPGPVFFRQTRLGLNAEPFTLFKLRTMTVEVKREVVETTSRTPGVTRVGGLLRRSKFDELPQLLNVLRGDMSLVGPRPCVPETMASMGPIARERFSVRPGLTGWAQVNGNVSLTWPERWRYDVEYTRRRSLAFDASILARTVLVVLLGEHRFLHRENNR